MVFFSQARFLSYTTHMDSSLSIPRRTRLILFLKEFSEGNALLFGQAGGGPASGAYWLSCAWGYGCVAYPRDPQAR
jgi:hypothetical protein